MTGNPTSASTASHFTNRCGFSFAPVFMEKIVSNFEVLKLALRILFGRNSVIELLTKNYVNSRCLTKLKITDIKRVYREV